MLFLINRTQPVVKLFPFMLNMTETHWMNKTHDTLEMLSLFLFSTERVKNKLEYYHILFYLCLTKHSNLFKVVLCYRTKGNLLCYWNKKWLVIFYLFILFLQFQDFVLKCWRVLEEETQGETRWNLQIIKSKQHDEQIHGKSKALISI